MIDAFLLDLRIIQKNWIKLIAVLGLILCYACSAIKAFSFDAKIKQIFIDYWDSELSGDLECSYLILSDSDGRFVVKVRYRSESQDIQFDRQIPKEYIHHLLDAYTTFQDVPLRWTWFRLKHSVGKLSEGKTLKVTKPKKSIKRVFFLLEDGKEFKFISDPRQPHFWHAQADKTKRVLYSEHFTEVVKILISRIDDHTMKRKALERK